MTRLIRVGLASMLIIILLAACGEPVYIPDASVIATREAAEYTRGVERGETAWKIGIGFISAILLIVIGLVIALSRIGYRVQAAKAYKAEGDARAAWLREIAPGQVLDMTTDTIRQGHSNAPPQVRPVERVQPLPPAQRDNNPIVAFVTDAATIAGWHSKTFPHWRKWLEQGYQMTGEEWTRLTGALVEAGYLNPKQQGVMTTVAGGNDLLWIANSLTPTPPMSRPANSCQNSPNS